MEDFRIKQLITFAIMMEENGGVVKKAPAYVREKYDAVMSCQSDCQLVSLLDSGHNKKYNKWVAKWVLN